MLAASLEGLFLSMAMGGVIAMSLMAGCFWSVMSLLRLARSGKVRPTSSWAARQFFQASVGTCLIGFAAFVVLCRCVERQKQRMQSRLIVKVGGRGSCRADDWRGTHGLAGASPSREFTFYSLPPKSETAPRKSLQDIIGLFI